MGLEPVVAPVLETHPLEDAVLDLAGVDALAFTSQAAVTAFAALTPQRAWPVFPVGEATAALARQAGFTNVRAPSVRGDAVGLADLIAATEPRPKALLNPTARDPAADLVALLAARGVPARSAVVYDSRRTTLAAAPEAIDGVLIHSARAAEAVADLAPPAQAAALTVYALSDAATASLRQRGFGRILVADRPQEAALLRLIEP
jgi:uroporphyrinogen-III synthase